MSIKRVRKSGKKKKKAVRMAMRSRSRDVKKMCRCDAQQLTEEAIMELIRQRGSLRFSTLMMFFHLSSVEALAIVENYQAKGILDEKGRYVTGKQGEGSVQEKKKTQKETKQQGKTECFRPVNPKIEGQISLFDYMQFHS